MATAFGWTWEYIDECVTLPRLTEIGEYWAEVPPLAESVAVIRNAIAGAPTPIAPATPVGEGSGENDAMVRELLALGFVLPAGA